MVGNFMYLFLFLKNSLVVRSMQFSKIYVSWYVNPHARNLFVLNPLGPSLNSPLGPESIALGARPHWEPTQ